MQDRSQHDDICLQVYDGYGHTHNLAIFGSVYKGKPAAERKFTKNIFRNAWRLVKLFFVKPVKGAVVTLQWQEVTMHTKTEDDGFFKFEWASHQNVEAGWHTATISLITNDGRLIKTAEGRIFIPHITQLAFISDIDDTVMISYSATIFKRLRVLLTRHPQNRKAFEGVKEHYKKLADAFTNDEVDNPFFYVSSSEWNLYADLKNFFSYNQLPEGIFLLSQLKKWHQLFKSGQTKHNGKLTRIYRILKAYPNQQFILLGDNSQADPGIYATIADKFPANVKAIYIRNVKAKMYYKTKEMLDAVSAKHNIDTFIFNNSKQAIEYSKKTGLIPLD